MGVMELDKIILVDYRSGRHPYAIYLLGICVVTGFGFMVGLSAPVSVQTTIAVSWAIRIWGLSLFMGGITSLFGIYWKWQDIVVGLRTEMHGKFIIILGGLVWTVSIIASSSPKSWSGVMFTAVFVVGSAWRILQIRKQVNLVRYIRLEYGSDSI